MQAKTNLSTLHALVLRQAQHEGLTLSLSSRQRWPEATKGEARLP